MALPSDSKARKAIPLATGLLDYFPDALAAVAEVSRVGNEQHNPGEPLHWDRSKSADHADCAARHFVERGKLDADGQRHTAKAVWRLLALLQLEIEAESKREGYAGITSTFAVIDEYDEREKARLRELTYRRNHRNLYDKLSEGLRSYYRMDDRGLSEGARRVPSGHPFDTSDERCAGCGHMWPACMCV